jgi:arylsulfatase A-like enzyme
VTPKSQSRGILNSSVLQFFCLRRDSRASRCRQVITGFGAGLMLAWICSQLGRADELKPNVLILMADDLGFSDLGCYGSEIATPVLDSLASTGIVFSNFHAAPTCSPTRAMLLTGVDHHRAGMGNMYEFLSSAPAQIGKPGYEGHLNNSVVTIAEVLKTAGYHTAISGKWHLGRRLAVSQAPVARGFDQSWVLWSGWAEHHTPAYPRAFVEGNRRVPYPRGQYSTELYTDKAIEFADEAINQDKPFFLFVSYTAPHWPLEAPADLIAKQKGKYDAGYDELRQRRIAGLGERGILSKDIQPAATPTRRPQLHHQPAAEQTRSWNELDLDERAYSARLMEVHAAMIESLDQNVGRLITHLQSRDQFNNTLVIFLSDNGAAPMASTNASPGNDLENVGRPGSFVGYGPEWARASTGPLRLMKGHATEGGTRVPAIIKLPHSEQHWVTAEFASVLDIAPTIYDVAGATYPKSFRDHELNALNGVSMLPYLTSERNRIHDHDDSMGWELFGRSAFRRGKWKITWIERPFGSGEFELFDIETDPGESRNVRAMYPDVYRQMVDGFEQYARTNGIVIARPPHWR